MSPVFDNSPDVSQQAAQEINITEQEQMLNQGSEFDDLAAARDAALNGGELEPAGPSEGFDQELDRVNKRHSIVRSSI